MFVKNFALLLIVSLSTLVPAAEQTIEIPLWPGVAPGSEASQLEEVVRDREVTDGTDVKQDRHVSGVTKPTLTVYLPKADNSTGAAVVILPGGGFNILAIDKEGHDVARWLNEQGIAGIVVKYRLPDPKIGLFVRNGSIPDVLRSIRLTRHNASQWRIDPNKIGVTGFSAGGYLTAAAGTLFAGADPSAEDPVQRVSSRPDFIAPVYPLVSVTLRARRRGNDGIVNKMLGPDATEEMIKQYSLEERVRSETPPTFLVHANDDRLTPEHSALFYLALKRAGVSTEMHIYSRGGHGYGIRQRGLPISSWGDRWLDWMRHEGFVLAE